MSCATNMPQQVYIHIVHNGPWIGNTENNISSRKYAIMTRIYLLFRFNIDWIRGHIILFKEVETEQFSAFFQPKLEAAGYSGVFYPKSRSKTMNEEERKYVDGCAIFWKKDK